MIGALSLRGFVAAWTIDGGTNSDANISFIEHILVPNLWSGACVVMDNLPAHKAEEVRQAIEAVGARLIYLSPYFPEFNPIENCWSSQKPYLRSIAAPDRDALDQAINDSMNSVTIEDIRNWFAHCCYCTSST